MGRAVLLETGSIHLVVSEERGVGGNHPIVYRHFGLEPAEAKMVVLKTASNWQYYQEMISEVIRVDTPGMTMSHLEQFNWVQLPRPIWPLDALPEWQAKV
jgi:microcystin degradation protein MlrC